MSTLVVLKEKNVLVLGTDSRVWKQDGSGIATDSGVPKICEVAPQTFIAASGWLFGCDFERAKARELATADVEKIAEGLRREMVPYLKQLVESSYSIPDLHTFGGSKVAGNVPVHASVLAGRNARGELGYIATEYSLRDGEIVVALQEHFGADRCLWVRPGEPVAHLAQDPRCWNDRPSSVVRWFLSVQKAANPMIGGLDQIVELSRDGVRWHSQPQASAAAVLSVDTVPGLAHATVNVGSGFTFTGTGGINIFTGAGVNVSPGVIFGATIRAGTGGFQLTGGTQVVNNLGTFVGAAVDVSGGCGANGFNPKSGGTQYYGITTTFRDADGHVHSVVGGVIVS